MDVDIVIGRLSTLLREQPTREHFALRAFPRDLARVRSVFGDHLIVLMQLARFDPDAAVMELQAIFNHCRDRALNAGITLTAAEGIRLREYLHGVGSTLSQLDKALKGLERETEEGTASLITSACVIVGASGARRSRELLFLMSLSNETV